MRVFYSHPFIKYSEPIEKLEMKYIRDAWTDEDVEIINPHDALPQDDDTPEDKIMEKSYKMIHNCDCVVFSTMSGIIGHGTYHEIIYALNTGKKVYQLYGTKLYSILSANSFIKDIVKSIIFYGDNREYAVVYPPLEIMNDRGYFSSGIHYSTASSNTYMGGHTTTE